MDGSSTRTETIYSIGHSTRSSRDFIALLRRHGVEAIADVRLIPKSARHPHFAREVLERTLPTEGIAYQHFIDLGGRRRPRRDSVNTAWRVEAFRGYADHMRTDPFRHALASLRSFARLAPTAMMCAEAVWWQCHRRLLADRLTVAGVTVLHILSDAVPARHELSEFAREVSGEVIYPGLL